MSGALAPAPVLQHQATIVADLLSAGRRLEARLVTGDDRAFGLNPTRTVVHVPYPDLERRWTTRSVTCGIALQCSPSKDRIAELPLADLTDRERRAVSVVEGHVAAAWAAATWPGLAPELDAPLSGPRRRALDNQAVAAQRQLQLDVGQPPRAVLHEHARVRDLEPAFAPRRVERSGHAELGAQRAGDLRQGVPFLARKRPQRRQIEAARAQRERGHAGVDPRRGRCCGRHPDVRGASAGTAQRRHASDARVSGDLECPVRGHLRLDHGAEPEPSGVDDVQRVRK